MPSLASSMMLTLAALRSDNPQCRRCGDTGWDARGWRIKRCDCPIGNADAPTHSPKDPSP
jgi:hypothetical protein